MKRTPLELAALASAAVPGLAPTAVLPMPDHGRDFDSAIVTDSEDNNWRVRSPQHVQAGFKLETEIQVLTGFTPAIRARLPFRIPSVAGAVQIDDLRTFVYHQIPGFAQSLDDLVTLPSQAREDIGRILAGIHALPRAVLDAADLPNYTAEEVRTRLLNELDQAAMTRMVPTILLRRWEDAFEEDALWNFSTTATHGDFHETNLLIDRDRAVGVTGWSELHWGDPANDLSWLASVPSPEFRDHVVAAYTKHREMARQTVDEHLMHRAVLTAEFALAQWLLAGQTQHDHEILSEAREVLDELAADVEATGGQDIGVKKPEPVTPITDADSADDSAESDEAEAADDDSAADRDEFNEDTSDADSDEGDDAVLTDYPVDDERVVALDVVPETDTSEDETTDSADDSVEEDPAKTEEEPSGKEDSEEDEGEATGDEPMTAPISVDELAQARAAKNADEA